MDNIEKSWIMPPLPKGVEDTPEVRQRLDNWVKDNPLREAFEKWSSEVLGDGLATMRERAAFEAGRMNLRDIVLRVYWMLNKEYECGVPVTEAEWLQLRDDAEAVLADPASQPSTTTFGLLKPP